MPIVSAQGFDISYSCNDAERNSSSGTLVLIHGAGGQEIDWPLAWRSSNDITRELGLTPKGHSNKLDKFQIYAVDLPGHGKSSGTGMDSVFDYANVIEAVIEALFLENVCVVGHSMGACIALALIHGKNPHITSACMIGGASKMDVSDTILEGLNKEFENTVENIVRYSWYKETGAFFKQKAIQRMKLAGKETVFNDFLACSKFDMSNELSEIDLPVLVIASDHDRMVKLDVSKSMSAEMPNSVFLPIENCGHFQHIEQTELVANEIANFLENHSKKTGSRRV